MAILGPSQLPVVFKVDSDPLKLRALSELGHPNVLVEIQEPQWEQLLRSIGDFVAHYFPLEDKYAIFYTNPLQTTYDIPQDAYYIREVAWDPITTRIDDIFGAESFLFCFATDTKVLRSDNELILISEWKPEYKVLTPFGPKKLSITKHEDLQRLITIKYTDGEITCTPNHPIKIKDKEDMLNNWKEAVELKPGDTIIMPNSTGYITNVSECDKGSTYTLCAIGARCLYVSKNGKPILVH